MHSLRVMHCEPCSVGAPTVTDGERARYAGEVRQWEVADVDDVPRLKRIFLFKDFKSA